MSGKIDYTFAEYVAAMKADNRPSFTTSANMISKGICVCDKCGKLANIDYKFCEACQEIIMIIIK